MTSTLTLRNLEVGSHFKFAFTNRYRNLKVVRVSDSSATITGEIQESGAWKPLGASYIVTPEVAVIRIDASEIEEIAEQKKTKQAIRIPGGKRGPGLVINFPVGAEFTIKQIADDLAISPSNVYIHFKKHHADLKPVRQAKSSTGRGKPTNYYLINA